MKRVLAVALALAPVASLAQDRELRLEGAIEQGALVRGFVERATHVSVDGRAVRVSERGEFLLAIDPDARAVRLEATLRNGRRISRELRARARTFATEHLPTRDDAEGRARAEARLSRVRLRDTATPYFRAGFEWPVHAPTTSDYGIHRTYRGRAGSRHWGVDLAAPLGEVVRAPSAGVVVLAEELPVMGNTVTIDHGHGLTSSLLHLSRIAVRVGERVERGAPIGAVGRSGNVTGVHLDWRMNLFSTPIDPRSVAPRLER
jgi:murein DD-endopeptidase MepM/ murein hydrolase activator NlpD